LRFNQFLTSHRRRIVRDPIVYRTSGVGRRGVACAMFPLWPTPWASSRGPP